MLKARDEAQKRGFATARGAQQREEFVVSNINVDAAQGRNRWRSRIHLAQSARADGFRQIPFPDR